MSFSNISKANISGTPTNSNPLTDYENLKFAYYQYFVSERIKMRYLQLRRKITSYALDLCISDYDKSGLTETEIECIKERTHTFLATYADFNSCQKDNFPHIYKT